MDLLRVQGVNKEMRVPNYGDLARGPMKKVLIAFDIDGTLRCNCTSTCRDVNEDVAQLARLFDRMKNTKLIAWSGGGKSYAQSFIDSNERLRSTFGTRCFSKFDDTIGKPDIVVDDIQETALGLINLIVNEK